MKKILLAAVAAASLAGCSKGPTQVIDQELRHKYFIECMEKLPKGPSQTKYNDWDDVVQACESSAYYQAIRMSDGAAVIGR